MRSLTPYKAAQQMTTNEKALTRNKGLWMIAWPGVLNKFWTSLHIADSPELMAGVFLYLVRKSAPVWRDPISLGSHTIPSFGYLSELVGLPSEWVWHVNSPLGRLNIHYSNDMRFVGIWGLLLLQASSKFLCQMIAENLDPVWNL